MCLIEGDQVISHKPQDNTLIAYLSFLYLWYTNSQSAYKSVQL